MSTMYLPGPATRGQLFQTHRFCGLAAPLQSAHRIQRSHHSSRRAASNGLRNSRLNQSSACDRKGHTSMQTRCRASAAIVVDDIETVEITDSDMLHHTQAPDSPGVDALVTNTMEIQRLSEDLQRQIASLTAFTPEDKERLGDAAQARRKEIDDNRLSRKQAKAASRTRSPAKDRSLPDITIDRQQSHSQASTSGSITMPTGRQTGQKPVHTNSAASRSRKAGSRQSKRGQAAASVIDSSQGGLSSRAKSRASNRSGRHSAWGTHTEASDSGLAVNGKSAGDPFSSESGVGTALGGLVKRSTHLLTAAEEYELTTHVKDLLHCESVKEELTTQMGHAPTNEQWAAGLQSPSLQAFLTRMEINQAAKRQMINCNQRLVMSIARKYFGRGLDLPDLVAEGITGLIKGVDRFDHTRGYKFSTYAHWWIRQAINRAICEQGRVVRLPSHLHEVQMKVKKAEKELTDKLLREPSKAEVAAQAGITEAKLHSVGKLHRNPASLEGPAGLHNEDSTLADFIPDDSETTPDEAAVHRMLTQDMDQLLYTLSARESEVLRLRYGLEDGTERTLEEVGRVMMVTRERIRQIEFKALRKLKDPRRCSVLKEYAEPDTKGEHRSQGAGSRRDRR